MIRRFTLDSTDNLLRLASVLTPDGHKTAKLQLRQPQAFAYDDEQVIEDDLVLEDFLPQLADHEDGETDEARYDEREVEMEVEEEDRVDPPELD
jgi:hypothetical protein